MKTTLVFIVLAGLFSTTVYSQNVDLISCLDSINNNIDFSGVTKYPNDYYFSVSAKHKNFFLLISQKKSFICKTDSDLKPSSVIEFKDDQVPEIKKLLYFQSAPARLKPQKLGNKPFVEKGYLIKHQSFNSAIQQTSDVTSKDARNMAKCDSTTNSRVLDEGLIQIAKTEIMDLTADWSEKMDSFSMAYGFDVKTAQKEFEVSLKRVLEKCSHVNELVDVAQKTAQRVGLRLDIAQSSHRAKTKSQPSLPSGTKQ